VTPKQAVQVQRRLASKVVATGTIRRRLRRVVGVDCSPTRDGRLVAAAVLCAAPDWHVVEAVTRVGTPAMPYIPGLLSFREAPLVREALAGIEGAPDLVLVDGQGRAHPRRLGLASHLGLELDVPTIGVGKSRLCGTHDEPGLRRGDQAPLVHHGERVGTVLRTRDGVKPVYVSVGNRIGLRPAVRLVLDTCTKYRLPEPIRHADRISRAVARGG
jgi:deoxyribonuclease V